MPEMGFNYRASDLHCALGHSQLAKLADFVAARRALSETYLHALAPLDPVVRPVSRTGGTPAWHLQAVSIDFESAGRSRARVMTELFEAGIGTQVHYIPVNRQPYYRERYGDMRLAGAEAYYARALSLPLFVGMTSAEVEHVATQLAIALRLPA
jgi:dTDP-4-amino-4,6-dideoxygalactose transaminase